MQVAEHESAFANLMATNPDFRKLAGEHSSLERLVGGIVRKKVVSADDEMELSRLKKLKLAAKDKMDRIMSEAIK
ncbi:MAG: DUF465 domain-containing protein [Nitrospinae bacterium]|nr:DUF465 domain-containing protein [Nitrospinota bacterium]